ncbi:GroES-like protein [Aspergillus eucalypticola CBS 122712]|uniref:GroES-like protein n=1 Tax=Aspergillus eucalypticola (strain CBS 122712 / IBT 29274) TaxID=1448314 RepID=A0A317VZK0_ASPEC|nr:GroES-like protein [Aspergillus eucalypticola CBS 122712]PWY79079.1 GroES-like protein [Aspergillus eucalypticola CBS 122712]
MRAVRYHGRGDIRVEEIQEPGSCGVGEVKIRPAFVGICGSDIHEYLHGPSTIPSTTHPITGEKIPVTLGHEFSGTITEVGEGVIRLHVGDKVAIKPNLFDGGCAACLGGWVNCCDNLGFVGFSGSAGGLSDYVVVKEHRAVKLPEGFELDLGALVEPLTVAWHAVNRSSIQNDNARTALVVGAGPIGLAVLLVLKARGMENIVVVEVSSQRRELAFSLGATRVLDPRADDVVATVRAMTGNAGADIAFECSAVQAGLDTALKGIRARGTMTVLSLWSDKPAIDAFDVVLGEKHVVGSVIYEDGEFEAVIDAMWSGKLNPRALITSKIRMEDIVEKGFKSLLHGRDNQIKILVDISA